MTKCYIVEINSSIEGIFDDLFDAGIYDYKYRVVDGTYIEITFPNVKDVVKLEEIMRWYV